MIGNRDAVEALDERECWELLELAPMGRIALAAAGEIDIFPLNFAVHAGCLWFRTAPGTKLVELGRQHAPKGCQILLYSSRSPTQLQEDIRTSGADGYITKNTTGSALVDAIRQWLNGARRPKKST